MAIQIDYNDLRYAQAAAEILRRHDAGEPEANITSAVRDFLILTGLASGEEMIEENPPAPRYLKGVECRYARSLLHTGHHQQQCSL